MILDGKKTSEVLKDGLRLRIKKIKENNLNPTLAIIRVGDVYASNVYVRNKIKYCEDVGVKVIDYVFTEKEMSMVKLIELICKLNKSIDVHGIIVQLPLPGDYDVNTVIFNIAPHKDVDGFTDINLGKLINDNNEAIIPATPKGIMNLLKAYDIDVAGKRCLVIGRGQTVGKPIAQLLINKDAVVTVTHSKSKTELSKLIKDNDIIISCVGKYNLFSYTDIKESQIVIDAGIARDPNGKLCGDFRGGHLMQDTFKYTPVPGGVGPMTIQALVENVVEVCERLM